MQHMISGLDRPSLVRRSTYQNQLEQILNAYADPVPQIRYSRVAWDQGEIGMIKVLRDSAKVPTG